MYIFIYKYLSSVDFKSFLVYIIVDFYLIPKQNLIYVKKKIKCLVGGGDFSSVPNR